MTLPNRPVPPLRPVPTPPEIDRPRPDAIDPALLLAVNFSVLIDGESVSCAHVSPLAMSSLESGLKQIISPDDRDVVLWSAPKQAGRLVIARALDGNRRLYSWRREAMSGKPAVRTIEINHLDRSGTQTLFTWELTHAWPVRWTGPRYDALHGGIAFEELEVVYNDLLWRGS